MYQDCEGLIGGFRGHLETLPQMKALGLAIPVSLGRRNEGMASPPTHPIFRFRLCQHAPPPGPSPPGGAQGLLQRSVSSFPCINLKFEGQRALDRDSDQPFYALKSVACKGYLFCIHMHTPPSTIGSIP